MLHAMTHAEALHARSALRVSLNTRTRWKRLVAGTWAARTETDLGAPRNVHPRAFNELHFSCSISPMPEKPCANLRGQFEGSGRQWDGDLSDGARKQPIDDGASSRRMQVSSDVATLAADRRSMIRAPKQQYTICFLYHQLT